MIEIMTTVSSLAIIVFIILLIAAHKKKKPKKMYALYLTASVLLLSILVISDSDILPVDELLDNTSTSIIEAMAQYETDIIDEQIEITIEPPVITTPETTTTESSTTTVTTATEPPTQAPPPATTTQTPVITQPPTAAPTVIVPKEDVVYWVTNGQVYHSTASCRSLSRSTNIQSGTIAESGKSRGCSNCFN